MQNIEHFFRITIYDISNAIKVWSLIRYQSVMGSRVGNSVEIIVYICTARGMEVKSCEDADNNIVMRRRTQQPGIH